MTSLTSPVMPLDWPVYRGHEHEQDLHFHPCADCLPWSVELIFDHPQLDLVVREWHAHDCPTLIRIEQIRAN